MSYCGNCMRDNQNGCDICDDCRLDFERRQEEERRHNQWIADQEEASQQQEEGPGRDDD